MMEVEGETEFCCGHVASVVAGGPAGDVQLTRSARSSGETSGYSSPSLGGFFSGVDEHVAFSINTEIGGRANP